MLSGKTGVGKTQLLDFIEHTVDLEGIANHRGSAFGKQLTPQPAQIDFENQLSIELLRHPDYVVLEDESRLIGRMSLPLTLQAQMKQAPICLLEDSLDNRVERILQEYVLEPLAVDSALKPRLASLHESLSASLAAIKKRLGGARYLELVAVMEQAFAQHQKGDTSGHRVWIRALLSEYYDPMYDYQLSKKQNRIVLRLSWQDVNTDPDSSATLDLRTYAS